jgi:hypothetical protein
MGRRNFRLKPDRPGTRCRRLDKNPKYVVSRSGRAYLIGVEFAREGRKWHTLEGWERPLSLEPPTPRRKLGRVCIRLNTDDPEERKCPKHPMAYLVALTYMRDEMPSVGSVLLYGRWTLVNVNGKWWDNRVENLKFVSATGRKRYQDTAEARRLLAKAIERSGRRARRKRKRRRKRTR